MSLLLPRVLGFLKCGATAGPSEEEGAASMPEAAQLGFGAEEMPSAGPAASAAVAVAAGEVDVLAAGLAGLKLDGGEARIAGGGDRDGDGEGLVPRAEEDERGSPTEGEGRAVDMNPPYVSGEGAASVGKEAEEAEESEVERAWRGQEEWRQEEEVVKEGAGQVEEGKGGQQEEKKEEEGRKFSYPQRPGEPDCAYYVRTGCCAFGANCKFNHPPPKGKRICVQAKSSDSEKPQPSELEKSQVKEKEKEEHSSGKGRIPCKYYQTPGGCKYGSNCRYVHEKERYEAGPELNFLGLPMRLGEKECPFYMRTGSCKFGSNCRFHHPNPTGVGELGPVSGYQDSGSSQHVSGVSPPPSTAWSSQSCSNQSVSFVDTLPSCVPGIFMPHQLHQNSEWNGYQAPPNSLYILEGNKQYHSVQTMYRPPTNVNGHSGQFQVQTEEYPQRPGQPECQFYMDNGSCRYKSLCRFHHPKDRLARPPMCLLSPMGLPLRPDQPVCTYYSRHGICKFGPTCRFDHPMDHGSSTTHPQTTAVIP